MEDGSNGSNKREPRRLHLTPERILKLARPTGSQPAYTYDDDPRQLCVRVTPAGARSFVFYSKLGKTPVRVTIGDCGTWPVGKARAEARRLQTLIDQGTDPRHDKAERIAVTEAKREAAKQQEVVARDAWEAYVEAMRQDWSERHHLNHVRNAKPGGKPVTRGRKKGQGKVSMPGILFGLLGERLADLTPERVAQWVEESNKRGATQTAQAYRQLRAFMNWCAEQRTYKGTVHADACTTKDVRKRVKSVGTKAGDCLQREQLKLWFQAVRAIRNPVHRNFVQIALLTGARLEELSSARWEGIDFEWRSLAIHDKTQGKRTIPTTPYVRALLLELQRLNQVKTVEPLAFLRSSAVTAGTREPSPWVFFSDRSADGRAQGMLATLRRATDAVGLPHVSIHGLRRSFISLSEWVEVPVGIVAQIVGHAPSAIQERHYKRRPLDLLRMWHSKIEAWMLVEAGVQFKDDLQVVGKTAA